MKQETLNKVESITTIISAIAIPLVIAVVGWWMQSSMKSQDIKKDYVQMAVDIIKDKDRQNDDDLRKWAVAVLDNNSPVRFSNKLREKLESGETRISFFFPSPPKILMSPPKELKPLNENKKVTDIDLVESVSENYLICRKNSVILTGLQKWVMGMKEVSLADIAEAPL